MLPSSLAVSLDRSGRRTLPVQLADHIRESISRGELIPDSRLPSSRALSKDLGVARGVAEQAYEQLLAEGWILSRRGSGTYVRRLPSAPPPRGQARVEADRPTTGRRISLRPGTPWVPARATAAWKRAWRDVAERPPPHDYPNPLGERELRTAVAALLIRARGMHTDADSVVITTGSIHGLGLALAALSLDTDSTPVLALENPGYRSAAAMAAHRGWSVFDVPVDHDGLNVERLTEAPGNTRAVYVTPSHQYPTGGLLTIGRRRSLAHHARIRHLMIIEDDYDSEFRYDVAPLPTVAALAPDRIIYLGTVSKTLGAGIRLGWLVAPPHVVRTIGHMRAGIGDFPSVPLQQAMTSLLRDGEWDRTVRTARRVYRHRDRLVTEALSKFGELRGTGAGLHSALLLEAEFAEAVALDAADAGVDVRLLAASTRQPSPLSGLVIGYGSVTDVDLTFALSVLTSSLEKLRR